MSQPLAAAIPAKQTPMQRRHALGALLAPLLSASALGPAWAAAAPAVALDRTQSQRFCEWMTLVIHSQLERGPSPRWTHRDCAGLVRFAVAEALREHGPAWQRASGLVGRRLPADIDAPAATGLRNTWQRADGSRGAFVGALELVQQNARFLSRQLSQAAPGDLLLYDFGDEQHLMVWMGSYLAYHTGHSEAGDNGLRALRPAQLLAWKDTRWRPTALNPNFAGLHRLGFLT